MIRNSLFIVISLLSMSFFSSLHHAGSNHNLLPIMAQMKVLTDPQLSKSDLFDKIIAQLGSLISNSEEMVKKYEDLDKTRQDNCDMSLSKYKEDLSFYENATTEIGRQINETAEQKDKVQQTWGIVSQEITQTNENIARLQAEEEQNYCNEEELSKTLVKSKEIANQIKTLIVASIGLDTYMDTWMVLNNTCNALIPFDKSGTLGTLVGKILQNDTTTNDMDNILNVLDNVHPQCPTDRKDKIASLQFQLNDLTTTQRNLQSSLDSLDKIIASLHGELDGVNKMFAEKKELVNLQTLCSEGASNYKQIIQTYQEEINSLKDMKNFFDTDYMTIKEKLNTPTKPAPQPS